MADARASRSSAAAVSAGSRRVLGDRSRLRLPSGRAVVGGLLVTLAAAGIFTVHRQASRPPTTRFVVATHTVEMGEVLRADDLGTIALELPRGVAGVPAADAERLVGRVAATRLDELDLLRPGDVLAAGRFDDPQAVEVALELPPARALERVIHPGSLVDVLSTDPDGEGTTVLASGVRVTEVGNPAEGAGIGSSGAVRVLVSISGSDAAARLVDASVRSELTLVLPRPTGEGPT